MRLLTLGVFLTLGLLPSIASAENCWMIGCKNEIGFLPVSPSIFENTKIKEGSAVAIANYATLRAQAIEKAQGPLVLGPGTVVKVLEILTAGYSVPFAIVRVVEDKNTRPDECKSKLQCRATIF
jgi:hypothetical protein